MKNTKDKMETIEIILGGIFGIITVIAAILEMQANGFSTEAIFGGLKDIAGTMVTVMVFLIAVRLLIPKKEKLTFEDKLRKALSGWEESNKTLIVKSPNKDDEHTKTYGFSMRTDIRNFYETESITKNVGWFVRLPLIRKENYQKEPFDIVFHLNKGTFFEGISKSDEELKQAYSKLSSMFSRFINNQYHIKDNVNEIPFASARAKVDEILVKIRPIISDNDIKALVNLLNSMFQAYLVSANIKVD